MPYLTIADRIYTLCYILTAAALGCAVMEAWWARTGHETRAEKVDRIGRKLFPLVFIVASLGSGVWGWYSKSDPEADVFFPTAAVRPPGHL